MSRQEETNEEDEDRQRPLSFLHLMSLSIPLNYHNNKPSNSLTHVLQMEMELNFYYKVVGVVLTFLSVLAFTYAVVRCRSVSSADIDHHVYTHILALILYLVSHHSNHSWF